MKNLRTKDEENNRQISHLSSQLQETGKNAEELVKGKQQASTSLETLTQKLEESESRRQELEPKLIAAETKLSVLEGAAERVKFLEQRLGTVQTEATDKDALVTRLRGEIQNTERSHAMKTAMLATSEASVETLTEKLRVSQQTIEEKNAAAMRLQTQIQKLNEEMSVKERTLKQQQETANAEKARLLEEHKRESKAMKSEQDAAVDTLRKEYIEKASVLESRLKTKENEATELTNCVNALQTEISSGAPNEKRIFELAALQAKREAGNNVHRDARELAFVQLQEALVARDLEVGNLLQARATLEEELLGLRRSTKRDGVNMAYLKNVVLQFMTFPLAAPERWSLVPVIGTLLQFNPAEVKAAETAARNPSWNTRPVKEIIASNARLATIESTKTMSASSPRAISTKTKPNRSIPSSLPLHSPSNTTTPGLERERSIPLKPAVTSSPMKV